MEKTTISGHDGRACCAHCERQTNMFCLKCEVYLCCNYMRNCYAAFHSADGNAIVSLPVWLMTHSDATQIESDIDQDSESDVDNPDSEPHETESISFDPEDTQ